MTENQAVYYRRTTGPTRNGWGASGLKGVYPRPGGHYHAKVRRAGQVHLLGSFVTADEAARAVAAKYAELNATTTEAPR